MNAITATEFVTSADGTRIAFERTGSGPALVLVDGAMCYREFGPARSVAAELADGYTVYFYDRRGRGESGDTSPYSVQREIEDLRAVIDATGEVPFVMGQSSGAALVLEAAASGVPMRKLAAYESPFVGLRPDKDGHPRDYLAQLDGLLARGDRGGAVGYFMVDMVGAPRFVPLMMRMMPKVWKQLQAVAHTVPNDARVMGSSFEVPTERFSTIGTPSLIMGGSKSKTEMLTAQERIAGAIPGAKHEVLAGQTHQVSPKALAPQLRAFFV
ncbi:alpha/beta fold hydrolase [Glaciihabitans arcticus]|nr:alpha/beta hydrolase [Glaciihabitans arcticus]